MSKTCVVIGIAGGTCSGKDIAVANFAKIIGNDKVTILHQDSYYKPLDKNLDPNDYNFDHPDAIDWELLYDHLVTLISGNSIVSPVYDFTTHSRLTDTVEVSPTAVIILEGILVLTHKHIRNLLNLKLFIDADSDKRLMRRIKRDMLYRGRDLESVINQYEKTVKSSHEKFIEPCKKVADFIIPNNEDNDFTGVSKLSYLVKPLLPDLA
jgi:uridine kinase